MVRYFSILVFFALSGCTTPTEQMSDKGSSVQVLYINTARIDNCEWLGRVTGTEGHWYNYFLYGNDVMITGAMNKVVNAASEIGGDTVVLAPPHDFVTSVTYQASVYKCQK
ncbi:DUF4156 domain-containing protein [Vibrio sp. HN007]|uniref:DUF4156 domain-containing protein n=1 Tax=Vibrio iocasae TaxID=3098914 RepID=UPI0035D4A676